MLPRFPASRSPAALAAAVAAGAIALATLLFLFLRANAPYQRVVEYFVDTRLDAEVLARVPSVVRPPPCRAGRAGLVSDTAEGWARRYSISKTQRTRQETASGPLSIGRELFQYNWEPTFHCAYAERLGAPGDGGKWICDPAVLVEGREKPVVVLSVGSHGDFSFETHMRARMPGAIIHTVDPGPYAEGAPDFVTYHQEFLTRDNLAKLLDAAAGPGGIVDVFKVDIEGGEYSVLRALLAPELRDRVQQLLVEVHMNRDFCGDDVNDLLRDLSGHYEIFAKEVNTLARSEACEFALVRVDWAAVCDVAE